MRPPDAHERLWRPIFAANVRTRLAQLRDRSVDARTEGNPTRDELMLMLQSLLEERFHLKVHHENREMPVYALTVARKGPELLLG